MGMFDCYVPVPAIACPWCGKGEVLWQGKDADNALFVWEQGVRNPREQRVPEESQCSASEMERCLLPAEFVFYGWCPDDHETRAVGRCEDGVWTTTDITASKDEADNAKEKLRWSQLRKDKRA
jgi:hypothetical protein